MKDKINGMVKYMYLMLSVIKAMHIILRLTTYVTAMWKITMDMLAFYSTSHYSTILYILQHYIKIVNQGRTTCGISTTYSHIDRKGQLRKYSRVLLSKYTYTQAMGYKKVRKIMNSLPKKSFSHTHTALGTFRLFLSS